MTHCRSALWVGIVCFYLPISARAGEAAAQWPPWRGPTYQGYSDDTRVPLAWGDNHNLLWKPPLPLQGNSSPIVWGGRIFLTAATKDGSERWVLCVRARDGKILW